MTQSPAHPDPEIRAYIRRCGGYSAFAVKHGISLRSAQRIYSGASACPSRLRQEALSSQSDEPENRP